MLTRAQIHRFLRESGISCHDTVPVHTSMRALGEVEGGCDGNRHALQFQKHGETGSEHFDVFRPPPEALGALSYGHLGNAEVGIFDAKRGMAVLKTLWERASYDLCKEPREIPLSYYADITV